MIAAALIALPPYRHRWACQFQIALYDCTGFEGFHTWPNQDEQYTGVVPIWDKWGNLRSESTYLSGARHGFWKEYHEDGTLKSVCEYKNGRPWNGVCQLFETKAWRAEFREGKPYNGCVWENDANGISTDFCFIDGQEVPVNEFMTRHKIEERDWLHAVDIIFTESQWKMLQVPVAAANITNP